MICSTASLLIKTSKSAILNFSRGQISEEVSVPLTFGFDPEKRTGKFWTANSGSNLDRCPLWHGQEWIRTQRRLRLHRPSARQSGRWLHLTVRQEQSSVLHGYPQPLSADLSLYPSQESVVWRHLQTNSCRSLIVYSYCYPGQVTVAVPPPLLQSATGARKEQA